VGRPALLVSAALVLGVVSVVLASALRGEESSSVRVVGSEQAVFDWSRSACGPLDYPDLPARAFRDSRGRVQLIASHFVSRRMVGPDLDHLRRDCRPIMTSHRDPRPGRFDDREWIGATHTRDGKTIFALIHNEYQGHQHPRACPSGEYERCWYNSITLAVSRDSGRSYIHARAPRHRVASIPYRYQPDAGPSGLLQPSNVVYRAADRHYYALFFAFGYREQARGTCLARTRKIADPTSWRAWDGAAFTVRFINPYSQPDEPPGEHVCKPVARDQISEMSQSLTFNTHLGRFLLVGTAGAYDPGKKRDVWGVYYSLSDDLLHWSRRRLILEAELPWTHRCGDRDPILYPSVIDPKSRSRNFQTSGRRVHLYFTRFNYTSCRQPMDRDLVRVPIEIAG
jgi:hypothetical protein